MGKGTQHPQLEIDLNETGTDLEAADLDLIQSPLEMAAGYIIDMPMMYYAVRCNAQLARDLLAAYNREPARGQAGTNRKASPVRIMRYRDAILRLGEWFLSPQPIVFSERTDSGSYEQQDGQQRLKALIEADKVRPGIEVDFVFCFDAPSKVKAVLDTGKSRSPADFLSMTGYANGPHLSSASKLLYCFLNVKYETPESWKSVSMTPTMTATVLTEHPGLVQALSEAQRIKSIIRPYCGATGYYLISQEYKDTEAGGVFVAAEFLGGLETGANLAITDPRLRLRESLMRARTLHRNRTAQEILAMMIKAFNAWMLEDDNFQPGFTVKERYPKLLTVKEYLEITGRSSVQLPKAAPGEVKKV